MPDPYFAIALQRPELGHRQNPQAAAQWLVTEFVGGAENRWVQSLFDQLSHAKQEPTIFNDLSPIVLYGASGTGKSALLTTLAATWMKVSDQKAITLTHGADFARDLTNAIEADDLDNFRTRYRKCGMLLMDDLHELVNRPAAQEELVSTLDALQSEGRPFATCLPRLPNTVRGLRSSLISRLSAGMLVSVEPPGLEARKHLLRLIAGQLRLEWTGAAMDRLASRVPEGTKVSQMRATLLRLNPNIQNQSASHTASTNPTQLSGNPWSVENEEMLESLIAQQEQVATPSMADIGKAVARYYQIRLADLRGSTRKANLVRARGVAMHLSRQLTSLSLQQIGRYFGGRDHTTVLHSCRKMETELASDQDLQRAIREVSEMLGSN